MQYSAGFVVHDVERPHIVRYRSQTPVMVPEGADETQGIVNNVVFPTAIDGCGEPHYDFYYGMADAQIGRAGLQPRRAGRAAARRRATAGARC